MHGGTFPVQDSPPDHPAGGPPRGRKVGAACRCGAPAQGRTSAGPHRPGCPGRAGLCRKAADRRSEGPGGRPSALFIDNADRIDGLAEALSGILRKYTVTVFLTGGSTPALESALVPAFSPAIAVVRVFPFSYREFLEAVGETDSRRMLELYCRSGGLPEGLALPSGDPAAVSLRISRANSFLLTEIIERASVRNPKHIRLLLELAASHTGEALPARQVCEAFAPGRVTISPQAVIDYLSLCRESGMLCSVPVLDIHRKKILDSGNVWYFGDAGLRSPFVRFPGPGEQDRARENLVYLQLAGEGWTVYRGRVALDSASREDISFVCEKEGKRIYLQMMGSSVTAAERIRRHAALLAVRDAWPKFVVDAENEGIDGAGVRTVFLRDLLRDGIGYSLLR